MTAGNTPAPLTLADCAAGTRVVLLSLAGAAVPARRLAEFGLRPGVAVEVRQQHRHNGVVLAHGEDRIALARDAAEAIRVAAPHGD
jgi:Fe2+ transport system protein FeoA